MPFIPDPVYRIVFPQRGKKRLTDRGRALVQGLVDNGIMIDLSHMDPPGIKETIAFLEEASGCKTPVVSTHAGYRFGKQRYMHDEETLLQIKQRGGVVGLIMAQHQLNDGLRDKDDLTETLDESLDVICEHIDKIVAVTGGFEHIALGTDFDGFVKPTPGGLKTMADLKLLEQGLRKRYDDEKADRMLWKNAIRMLHMRWPEAEPVSG